MTEKIVLSETVSFLNCEEVNEVSCQGFEHDKALEYKPNYDWKTAYKTELRCLFSIE